MYEAAVEELLRVKRKTQNKVDDLLDQDAAMEKSTKTRFKDLIDSFDVCFDINALER